MTSTKNYRVGSFDVGQAIKAPVKLVTTANVATLSGEQTIETVAMTVGDRVLLAAQTDQTENGIYTVETSAWQRAGDWNGSRDAADGTLVVSTQSGNKGIWQMTTSSDPFTPGTDTCTFAQLV